MSEWCERTSERRSEWPSTQRVDFISILPNVEWPSGVAWRIRLRPDISACLVFGMDVVRRFGAANAAPLQHIARSIRGAD